MVHFYCHVLSDIVMEKSGVDFGVLMRNGDLSAAKSAAVAAGVPVADLEKVLTFNILNHHTAYSLLSSIGVQVLVTTKHALRKDPKALYSYIYICVCVCVCVCVW